MHITLATVGGEANAQVWTWKETLSKTARPLTPHEGQWCFIFWQSWPVYEQVVNLPHLRFTLVIKMFEVTVSFACKMTWNVFFEQWVRCEVRQWQLLSGAFPGDCPKQKWKQSCVFSTFFNEHFCVFSSRQTSGRQPRRLCGTQQQFSRYGLVEIRTNGFDYRFKSLNDPYLQKPTGTARHQKATWRGVVSSFANFKLKMDSQ